MCKHTAGGGVTYKENNCHLTSSVFTIIERKVRSVTEYKYRISYIGRHNVFLPELAFEGI